MAGVPSPSLNAIRPRDAGENERPSVQLSPLGSVICTHATTLFADTPWRRYGSGSQTPISSSNTCRDCGDVREGTRSTVRNRQMDRQKLAVHLAVSGGFFSSTGGANQLQSKSYKHQQSFSSIHVRKGDRQCRNEQAPVKGNTSLV